MDDQKQLWLAEYKELGLEARQYNSEVYQTNRLMLPALIIGLLILYGAADKLPWLKIDDPWDLSGGFFGVCRNIPDMDMQCEPSCPSIPMA